MYVCMYVCMYVYMYVCMYGCMYGCMIVWLYGCMIVWLYGCMIVWLYGCMHIFPMLNTLALPPLLSLSLSQVAQAVAPHLSPIVLHACFDAADTNRDGRVSYRDFALILSASSARSRVSKTTDGHAHSG